MDIKQGVIWYVILPKFLITKKQEICKTQEYRQVEKIGYFQGNSRFLSFSVHSERSENDDWYNEQQHITNQKKDLKYTLKDAWHNLKVKNDINKNNNNLSKLIKNNR